MNIKNSKKDAKRLLRFRELCNELHISYYDIAEMTECSYGYVKNMMSGQSKMSSVLRFGIIIIVRNRVRERVQDKPLVLDYKKIENMRKRDIRMLNENDGTSLSRAILEETL